MIIPLILDVLNSNNLILSRNHREKIDRKFLVDDVIDDVTASEQITRRWIAISVALLSVLFSECK